MRFATRIVKFGRWARDSRDAFVSDEIGAEEGSISSHGPGFIFPACLLDLGGSMRNFPLAYPLIGLPGLLANRPTSRREHAIS